MEVEHVINVGECRLCENTYNDNIICVSPTGMSHIRI